MFNKKEYIDRFSENILKCIEFSEVVLGHALPRQVKCNVGPTDFYEDAIAKGCVKWLGGRILAPEDIKNVSVLDVINYTFIDGKVPVWINLCFEGSDGGYSYIRVVASGVITGDEADLYLMPEGKRQFHMLIMRDDDVGIFPKAL